MIQHRDTRQFKSDGESSETTSFTDSMVTYSYGVIYSWYIHSSSDDNHGDNIHSSQYELSVEFTVAVNINSLDCEGR